MSFFPQQNGGLFKQGAFQIDQNSTPEMIKAKRAQIASLLPQFGKANYVGEGIGQLATGIVAGKKGRALDKFEGERSAEAAEQFNNLMSGNRGGSGPMSILGVAQQDDPPSPEQAIADDTMAALGKPQQPRPNGNKQAFIEQMMPHAMRVSQQTGLDPRVIIAQAAQETGWGKSAPGNNYFGIKSHGKSGGNTFATNEVVDGKTVRINDSFRGYEGMSDSVDGYAEFLKENPRYRDMLSAPDLDGQIAALGRSGYATDPNYANSVGSIARSIGLPDGFQSGQGVQVAQNSGPELNDLMMAAQNPWLTPQQRSVINSQIQTQQGQQQAMQEQALKQSDPMYQTQLAQAQYNLNRDQSGMPVQGSAFGNLDSQARAGGLQPGTPEYQDFMLNGGGAPSNFRALDMQAQAAGLQPGTPDYAEFMATRGAGLQAGAKATATNEANIATGGQAEAAKDLGKASMAAGVGAWESYGKMQTSLSNIDTAIAALDSGAKSGPVYNMLPSITEASASLENSMNRMGLDIVGAVTFGALSEGELRLAMNTAVPQNLGPTELRSWLVKRKDAQTKAAAMIADAAQYLTNPQNNLNGWIEKNRQAKQSAGTQAQPARVPYDPQTPDFSQMSDEELQDYIAGGGK